MRKIQDVWSRSNTKSTDRLRNSECFDANNWCCWHRHRLDTCCRRSLCSAVPLLHRHLFKQWPKPPNPTSQRFEIQRARHHPQIPCATIRQPRTPQRHPIHSRLPCMPCEGTRRPMRHQAIWSHVHADKPPPALPNFVLPTPISASRLGQAFRYLFSNSTSTQWQIAREEPLWALRRPYLVGMKEVASSAYSRPLCQRLT